jgi:hypothetical protein
LPFELGADQRLDEQDFPTLAPGEARECLVAAAEDAYARAKNGPAMLWRVKLRKGLNAQGHGVASVVGVPFSLADIKLLAEPDLKLLDG